MLYIQRKKIANMKNFKEQFVAARYLEKCWERERERKRARNKLTVSKQERTCIFVYRVMR